MPTTLPTPAVFPYDPDGGFPLRERWTWATDVISGNTGAERRIPLAFLPRLNVTWTITGIDPGEAATLLGLLWDETDNRWLVPRWTSVRPFTKSGSVYTADLTGTDFLTNGKAIVWRSSKSYDVMTISAQTSTTLTLTGSTSFDHTLPSTYVAPLMTGSLTPQYDLDRSAALVGRLELTFTIDVSEYNYTPPAGTAAQTYRGAELFTDVFSADDLSETWATRSATNGGLASSKFVFRPLDTYAIGTLKHKAVAVSRAEYRDLKRFLTRRQGRAVPCWIVAAPEASVALAGTAGGSTLTLKDVDFLSYYGGDPTRKDIAFMINGVLYPHRVTSWTTVSEGSRANLETILAVNVPIGTLVSFLRFCRLAADTFELETYPGMAAGEVPLEFTEVPFEVPA